MPIEQAETPEVVELPDDDAGAEERKAQAPAPWARHRFTTS